MRALTIGQGRLSSEVCAWIAALCLLAVAAPALAGGGVVLPPSAQAKGYSLAGAATATAYFNEGPRTPDTVPAGFPFQILYVPADGNLTFNVQTGTMFYVPLVYSDDSDTALWPFPDVNDPEAVSDYYFESEQLGAETLDLVVDGKVTSLGRNYAVGAVTPGLPTGGNSYTVVAAYLGPMSKGTHSVTIRVLLKGAFLLPYFPTGYGFEANYTVIVH